MRAADPTAASEELERVDRAVQPDAFGLIAVELGGDLGGASPRPPRVRRRASASKPWPADTASVSTTSTAPGPPTLLAARDRPRTGRSRRAWTTGGSTRCPVAPSAMSFSKASWKSPALGAAVAGGSDDVLSFFQNASADSSMPDRKLSSPNRIVSGTTVMLLLRGERGSGYRRPSR